MNPYQPPRADVAQSGRVARRHLNGILGFLCALVSTSLFLYAVAFVMAGEDARFPNTLEAWSVIAIGSLFAGAVAWHFNRRFPSLLTASIMGPLFAITCLLWFGA
jgi:hypothetical protein